MAVSACDSRQYALFDAILEYRSDILITTHPRQFQEPIPRRFCRILLRAYILFQQVPNALDRLVAQRSNLVLQDENVC